MENFNRKLFVSCLVVFLLSFFARIYPVFLYSYPPGAIETVEHTIMIMHYLPKYPFIVLNYNRGIPDDPLAKTLSKELFFLQDNPPFLYLAGGSLAHLLAFFAKDIYAPFIAVSILYSLLPVALFLFLRHITKSNAASLFGSLFLAILPADLWYLLEGHWGSALGSLFFFLAMPLSFKYSENPARKSLFLTIAALVLMLLTYPPFLIPYIISMAFFCALCIREKRKWISQFLKISVLCLLISLPFLINFISSYTSFAAAEVRQERSLSTGEAGKLADLTGLFWIFPIIGSATLLISFAKKTKIKEAIQLLIPIAGLFLSFLLAGILLNIAYFTKIFGATLPYIIASVSAYGVYFICECSSRKNARPKLFAVPIFLLLIFLFGLFSGNSFASFWERYKPALNEDKYGAISWVKDNTEANATVHFMGIFYEWRFFSLRNTTHVKISREGNRLDMILDYMQAVDADYTVVYFGPGGYYEPLKNFAASLTRFGFELVYSNKGTAIFKMKSSERPAARKQIIENFKQRQPNIAG